MNILVIIYSNDPETAWNAFRFATTSLIYDNKVTVFLLGKGVEAALVGTINFDIEEQLEQFRENGGEMIGCAVCCESRSDEMPHLEQSLNCKMGSMQQLYQLTVDADKVVTF